jgi:hypothetical protein
MTITIPLPSLGQGDNRVPYRRFYLSGLSSVSVWRADTDMADSCGGIPKATWGDSVRSAVCYLSLLALTITGMMGRSNTPIGETKT